MTNVWSGHDGGSILLWLIALNSTVGGGASAQKRFPSIFSLFTTLSLSLKLACTPKPIGAAEPRMCIVGLRDREQMQGKTS